MQMVMARRGRFVVGLFLGLVIVMAVAAGLVARASGGVSRTYNFLPPEVPPGIHLKQQARRLEKGILDHLGPNSHLISVRVVLSRRDVNDFIPNHGGGPGWDADKLTWIIWAFGKIEGLAPIGAEKTPVHQGSVHFLIDDETGLTLGYGTP